MLRVVRLSQHVEFSFDAMNLDLLAPEKNENLSINTNTNTRVNRHPNRQEGGKRDRILVSHWRVVRSVSFATESLHTVFVQ